MYMTGDDGGSADGTGSTSDYDEAPDYSTLEYTSSVTSYDQSDSSDSWNTDSFDSREVTGGNVVDSGSDDSSTTTTTTDTGTDNTVTEMGMGGFGGAIPSGMPDLGDNKAMLAVVALIGVLALR